MTLSCRRTPCVGRRKRRQRKLGFLLAAAKHFVRFGLVSVGGGSAPDMQNDIAGCDIVSSYKRRLTFWSVTTGILPVKAVL